MPETLLAVPAAQMRAERISELRFTVSSQRSSMTKRVRNGDLVPSNKVFVIKLCMATKTHWEHSNQVRSLKFKKLKSENWKQSNQMCFEYFITNNAIMSVWGGKFWGGGVREILN